MKRNELVLLEVTRHPPRSAHVRCSESRTTTTTRLRSLTHQHRAISSDPARSAARSAERRADPSDQRNGSVQESTDYAICAGISSCANSLSCPTAMTVSFVALTCWYKT